MITLRINWPGAGGAGLLDLAGWRVTRADAATLAYALPRRAVEGPLIWLIVVAIAVGFAAMGLRPYQPAAAPKPVAPMVAPDALQPLDWPGLPEEARQKVERERQARADAARADAARADARRWQRARDIAFTAVAAIGAVIGTLPLVATLSRRARFTLVRPGEVAVVSGGIRRRHRRLRAADHTAILVEARGLPPVGGGPKWAWWVTLAPAPGAAADVFATQLHMQDARPSPGDAPPEALRRHVAWLRAATGLPVRGPMVIDTPNLVPGRGAAGATPTTVRLAPPAPAAPGEPPIGTRTATYNSLDEVPPHLRPLAERMLREAQAAGSDTAYGAEGTNQPPRVWTRPDDMPPEVRRRFEDPGR